VGSWVPMVLSDNP